MTRTLIPKIEGPNKFKKFISPYFKHLAKRHGGLFRGANFEFRVSSKRGFTLLESLAVISILGVLATTAIYTYTSATSRSRDARRKSDLTAISLGFQARHDVQTCSNANDIGYYPGRNLGWPADGRWKSTEILRTLNNDCGSFSEFLITVPTDPREGNGGLIYRFDLSNQNDVIGRHYRLTAKLEKTPNETEQAGLARAKLVWENSFGGVVNTFPPDYNYIVGN